MNEHIEPRSSTRGHEYYEEEQEVPEKTAGKNRGSRGSKRKIKDEENYMQQEQTIDESQMQEQVERYPVTDPRKPFVCQQCGIGFARQKALSSHSRVSDSRVIMGVGIFTFHIEIDARLELRFLC